MMSAFFSGQNGGKDRIPPPPKPGDRKDRPGGGGGPQPPGNRFGNASRTLAFWAILVLVMIIGYQLLNSQTGRQVELESFNEFQELIDRGEVEEVLVVNNTEIHGKLRTEITRQVNNSTRVYHEFHLIILDGIIDKEMLDYWSEKGVSYSFKQQGAWGGALLYLLPFFAIIFLWIFMMRQMQGGQRGVFSFGKSRAKLLTGGKVKVTFNDVAGADEAKQELQEVIDFLKDPAKFQKLGGKIPKGVLLTGPPGTGKTLLARAVAGEADAPFFSLSGSEFVEMFVGVGASRVRDLFEQGKTNAPCIIFIDELDAVGRHRGAGLGGGHDEREQTLNQLLVEMDGFESNEGVILISATNRPDVLDPALLRPGRFDRQVVVDLPDVKGREGILRVHSRHIPLDNEVDMKIVAKTTPGLSGADLANLVNEAALLAARFDRSKVTMADLEEAKDKVMMGAERRSLVIADDEKRRIAFHEAAHALIGKLTPGSDPVHKVTIIPRGRALGLTHYLPIDERHIHSKDYLLGIIKHLMAGRSAEMLIFGEVTTGAGNDIQRATALARKMVQEWGMSEKLGPLYYGEEDEEIFLGRAISRHKDRSEETAELIDEEVKSIIKTCEDEVDRMLKENIESLKNLAETLLEYEILSGSEIDLAIAGKPLHREPGEPERLTLMEEKEKLPDIETVAAELEENADGVAAGGSEEVDQLDGAGEVESGTPAGSDVTDDGPEGSALQQEDGDPKP
jgi:cell division protease FtsH